MTSRRPDGFDSGLRGSPSKGRLKDGDQRSRRGLLRGAVQRVARAQTSPLGDRGCRHRRRRDRACATVLEEEGFDNISARVADVTTQLGERVYDAVAALECLTLVEDDEAAIGSFARALKPGGLLIGHVPEKNRQPLLSTRTTWPGERRHGYTESEIRDLLGRAGLEQVSITPTTRQLALLGREVAASDRMYRGGLLTRLVWFPFAVAFTWLDHRGITWGPAAGYYFEARSPVRLEGDSQG